MAKASLDGRRNRRASGKMSGTTFRVSLLTLFAAAAAPVQAQKAPAAASYDEIPVPLCTAGMLAGKSGEPALGLYELGDGKTMVEWVDGELAAEACFPATSAAKALPNGLRLTVDNVSIGLVTAGTTAPAFIYNPSATSGQLQTTLLEPALCESYADAGDSPLSLSLKDTNGVTRTLHGIESLSYSPASGGLTPRLTMGKGPLLRCHAVTGANTPLPVADPDLLFDGGFESNSDLHVEFLDAQGVRLAANVNDQYVNQPLAAVNGVTYQVLVTNAGDGPATGVRVREFIPLTGGSVSPTIQTVGCGATPQGSAAYCAGGTGAITDNIASLAPGETKIYTVTRKAAGNAARTSVSVFNDPTVDDDLSIADNSRSLAINLVANQAPIAVGTIANVQANEGEAVNIVTATAFSDPDGNTLTYSATGLPTGIAINQTTGVISGNLGYNSNGSYNVVVTASDGSLTASQPFTLTVIDQNGAPVAVGTLPNLTLAEGDMLEFTAAGKFTDPDGDTLVYSAVGLPQGIPFSPTSGNALGVLSMSSAGVYQITITASDTELSADLSFTLTVTNVNTDPTVATPIPDQSNDEGDVVALNIASNFADADQGDTLTFAVTGGTLPDGVTLSAAGQFSGTIGDTAAGDYTITVTADDGNGGTVSDTFDWEVVAVNLAPVAVGTIADRTATEGAPFSISASIIAAAFDDPDGDTLTYSVDGPAWLGIVDGFLFGTPPAASADDYEITITATDPGGEAATQTFTLTVNAP